VMTKTKDLDAALKRRTTRAKHIQDFFRSL
jgi:hypothetical protein